MSTHQDILNAVKSECELSGVAAPVVIREIPKTFEGVEGLPVMIVAPGRFEELTKFAFEGIRQIRYEVSVVLLAASDQDLQTALGANLQSKEDLRNQLYGDDDTLANVPEVCMIDLAGDDVFDEAKLDRLGYAWMGLTLSYTTME